VRLMSKVTDLLRWATPAAPAAPEPPAWTPPPLSTAAALPVPAIYRPVVAAAASAALATATTYAGVATGARTGAGVLTAAVPTAGDIGAVTASRLPRALQPPRPREWQERAWAAWRHCGEARQAVEWICNNLSRCHLYIGDVDPASAGDPKPAATPGLAGDILAELHNGRLGQSAMLARLGLHLLVPGESWLAGYPRPPAAGGTAAGDDGQPATQWSVLSRREWSEVTDTHIRFKLADHPNPGADGWVTFASDEVVLIPIYVPDAEDATTATSAFEAALDTLDELFGLSRRVAVDIKSRLAGAGALPIPESATLPTPGASDGLNGLHGDPFVAAFARAAKTAIQNPDDVAALLPIFFRVPDESLTGNGFKLITFATPFDAQVPVLRQDARRTLAADLNIPASIVLGVEDLNHWSMWGVTEDALKSHMGPLAAIICTQLTIKVLWPALRAAGETDVEKRCIWWDPSEVVLRPDGSTVALTAHRDGVIGGKATRREIGFSEEDAPTAEETAARAAANQPPPAGAQGEDGGQATPSQRPNPPADDGDSTPDGTPPAQQ